MTEHMRATPLTENWNANGQTSRASTLCTDMRYLYPRFTRLSLKTSNVSVSSLCVHDSGKWVHVVYFTFLPSQVTSKFEDLVCLRVVRAHVLPYQMSGVCGSLSINVNGQLSRAHTLPLPGHGMSPNSQWWLLGDAFCYCCNQHFCWAIEDSH